MIEEVKQIFDDIRDAIIEMGGDIDVCSSPEEYAEAIKELTGNTAVLFIPCFKSSELKPSTPTKTMSPADPTDYPEGGGTPDGLTGKIGMTYTMVSTSTVYVPGTEPVLLGEAGPGPQPSVFDDATTRTFLIFLELPSLNITPTRPVGGNWNTQDNILYNNPTFTFNGVTYTWSSDNNHVEGNYTWLSQGTFLAETGELIGTGTNPICINSVKNGRNGKDGRNGQDGTDIEFIYKLAHSETEGRQFPTPESENIDDYVPGPNPNTRGYWCDHPMGIDGEEYLVEMMCTREKNKETGNGGPFIGPVVGSSWGEDGTDGDGIEYIFRIASNAEVTGPDAQGKYHLIASAWPPTCGEGCASAYYTVASGHGYTREQLTEMYQDDEFVPGNDRAGAPSAESIGWDRNGTDDPLDVSVSQPFEFVSVRKFKFNESTGQGEGGWFSEPVLWNKFGTTASPVFTSFVFCRTKQNIGSMVLTGGTEFDPLPSTQYWPINDPSDPNNEKIEGFDTVPGATEYIDDPDPTRFTSPIWMASRIFGSIDPNAQQEDQGGTSPTLIADSKYFNVEYSASNFLTESVTLPKFDATINGAHPFIDETNEEGVNESAGRTYCRTHDAQGHVVVEGSPTCLGVGGDGDAIANPIGMATCSFGENGGTEGKVSRIEGEAGQDGTDGAGVEYVYIRTSTNVAPTVRSKNGSTAIVDSNGHTYVDDEFLPLASGGSLQTDTECTDDPTGVDNVYQYEWVAKRIKVFAQGSTTDRVWEEYTGAMALWAKGGEKGDPGADSKEREGIYKLDNSTGYNGTSGTVGGDPSRPISGNARFTTDDFVPTGWSDSPTGISASHPTEYASYRTYNPTTERGSDFTAPVVWSHGGEKGQDGDGVQYIYNLYPRELTVSELTTFIPSKPGSQDAHGEGLPATRPSADTISKNANGTDDPEAVSSTWPYCYCSQIKRVNGSWESAYGTLSLGAKGAKDGDQGQQGDPGRIGPKMRMRNGSTDYGTPPVGGVYTDEDGEHGWLCGNGQNDNFYDIAIYPVAAEGINITNAAANADRLYRCTQSLSYADLATIITQAGDPALVYPGSTYLQNYFTQAVGWDFVATSLLLADKIRAEQIDATGISVDKLVTTPDIENDPGSFINAEGNTMTLYKSGNPSCIITADPLATDASETETVVGATALGEFMSSNRDNGLHFTRELGRFTIQTTGSTTATADYLKSLYPQWIGLQVTGTANKDITFGPGQRAFVSHLFITATNLQSPNIVYYGRQNGYVSELCYVPQGQSGSYTINSGSTGPGTACFKLDTTDPFLNLPTGTGKLELSGDLFVGFSAEDITNYKLAAFQYTPQTGALPPTGDSQILNASYHSPITLKRYSVTNSQTTEIASDGFAHVLNSGNYFKLRHPIDNVGGVDTPDPNTLLMEFRATDSTDSTKAFGLKVDKTGIYKGVYNAGTLQTGDGVKVDLPVANP